MKIFRVAVLSLTIVCCFFLAALGFNGGLPSFLGGLAWLFLLMGRMKDVIDVVLLESEEQRLERLALKLNEAINNLREKQCEKD